MSLKTRFPSIWRQLEQAGKLAERHFRDCVNMEFTFQNGQLFVEQCSPARIKATGIIQLYFQLLADEIITPEEVLERIEPTDVAVVLRPEIIDLSQLKLIGNGNPVSGGAATGRIAFSISEAQRLSLLGHPAVLVVTDVRRDQFLAVRSNMVSGVLDILGGISAHPAFCCRPVHKPCVVGFRKAKILWNKKVLMLSSNISLKEGDWLTVDGATGNVYIGKSRVETKPWDAHPELVLLDFLIEKAVTSGRVPPKATGAVWTIWDFMRHGLPLTAMKSETRPTLDKQRTFSLIPSKKTEAARKTLTPIGEASRKNYSDIILGLMATLERLFACSSRRQQAYCRELWNPEHQYSPENESQLVGFEYFGINHRIPHLIELANICIHLECKPQSPSEAWTLESSPDSGVRVVPRSRSISACQIWVNGAELGHEELPKFHTWLRRREYFLARV